MHVTTLPLQSSFFSQLNCSWCSQSDQVVVVVVAAVVVAVIVAVAVIVVIAEGVEDLQTMTLTTVRLLLLFCSLNIDYPSKLRYTFEHIQKVFGG